jgi:chitin disaccharide deacetylase
LPPGLSEWAVHPSLGDAEAQALEPETWQVRRADFEFVTSADTRAFLEEESIIVLDYRSLQQVWVR